MINGLFRIVKSCKANTRARSAFSVVNLNTSSLREVSYFSKRQRQTTCFFIGFKLNPALFFPFKELFVQILWSLNVSFEISFKILPATAHIAESQRHLQVLVVLKSVILASHSSWRHQALHWISGSLPPKAVPALWHFRKMLMNTNLNRATPDTGAACVHSGWTCSERPRNEMCQHMLNEENN